MRGRAKINKVVCNEKSLYIIDGHAHIYAAFYVWMSELTSPTGEIKSKRGESLRSSKDKAILSKELVTIDCSPPFEIDHDAFKLTESDAQTSLKSSENLILVD